MSLLTAAAAAVTLVGCSASAPTAAIAPSTPAVPEGVAAQYAQVNEEIRAEGGETTSGEWRIGYIVEPAEPWHVVAGSGHTFRDPAPGETHHIEIVPIRLEVLDGSGKVVEAKSLNFYYAEFFHYANNFSIPAPGRYTLRAKLDAPTFPRHGESTDTPPLSSGVTVEFRNVELAG